MSKNSSKASSDFEAVLAEIIREEERGRNIDVEVYYRSFPEKDRLELLSAEQRRHWMTRFCTEADSPAPFDEQERAFEHLRQALKEVHFL